MRIPWAESPGLGSQNRAARQDVTDRVLADDQLLAQLYSAPLFDHELIRSLRLIPTEYLYFYYSRRRALANQSARTARAAAKSEWMNEALFRRLRSLLSAADESRCGMRLHGIPQCPLRDVHAAGVDRRRRAVSRIPEEDPFRAANGYHRIALDVMSALRGQQSRRVIVNVRNQGAIDGIDANDVVEVPCRIAATTFFPSHVVRCPQRSAAWCWP